MSLFLRLELLSILLVFICNKFVECLSSTPSIAGSSSPGVTRITPNPSLTTRGPHGSGTGQANSNGTSRDIPGVWYSACQLDGSWPCMAFCSSADTSCLQSANSVARTCASQWQSYSSVANGFKSAGPQWHNMTSIVSYTNPGGTRTTEIEVYTSFSTATEDFIFGVHTVTTVTPVYALGSPVTSIITTSEPLYPQPTYTVLTAPTPECKYTAADKMDRAECGKCTITGGTVDLYFWPPSTTPSITTAVLNDHTLTYPTVYISLRTVYASDSCLQVGKRHHGTLLPMNASELSTQIHIGGKVAAYTYSRLKYEDLTKLPPASNYEAQPSCQYTGCPTIYYTNFHPTLVVPSQIRSLDPAWATCDLALEGLYDPPVALTARDVEATVTMSEYAGNGQTSPRKTPGPGHPEKTWSVQTTLTTARAQRPKQSGKSMGPKVNPTISVLESILTGGGHASIEHTSTRRHVGPSKDPATLASSSHIPSQISTRESSGPDLTRSRQKTQAQGTNPGTTTTNGSDASQTSLPPTVPTRETIIDGHTARSRETDIIEATKKSTSQLGITVDEKSQYVINGQTLAPGSPITLPGDDGPVTFRMLTLHSRTYIAVGTTKTVPLDGTTSTANALAFTRASNGDFVLHGTTLASGQPITIGRGTDRTTLRLTSVRGTPAIVVNNATTELLGHNAVSSSMGALPSITSLPATTNVSSDTILATRTAKASTSSTPTSTSKGFRTSRVSGLWLISLSVLIEQVWLRGG